jgi:hypothetical protein
VITREADSRRCRIMQPTRVVGHHRDSRRASKKCAYFMVDTMQMFLKLVFDNILYVTRTFLPYHFHKCTML